MLELTAEQDVRLNNLLAHLQTFPMAELIVISGELRLPRPLDETGKKRFRQTLGGAHAIGKIAYYMHTLRQVDENRMRLGKEYHTLIEAIPEFSESDPERAIELEAQSTLLSGLQEVTYHFFAICVAAIDGLLPLVASATGYKIPSVDKAVLHSYIPLRDYFEHMENRAPGKSYAAEVVVEHVDEHQWRVTSGFNVDKHDRIVINGEPIDVTSHGLAMVNEVVARSYANMRHSCLRQVDEYFRKHSGSIPTPAQVPFEPLASVFTKQGTESILSSPKAHRISRTD